MKPYLPAFFFVLAVCLAPFLQAESASQNNADSTSRPQAMMMEPEAEKAIDELDALLATKKTTSTLSEENIVSTTRQERVHSDSSGGTTLDTSLEAEETPRTSLVNNPTADTNSLSADNSDYRQNKLQSKINEFFATKNNQNINKNRELLNTFKLALQKEYGIPTHELATVLTNDKEDQIIAYGLTNDLENEIKERTVAYQRAQLSEDIEEIDNETYYRESDRFERFSNYQNDKNDVKGFQQDFQKLADFKTILKQNYGKHGENVFTPEEEQQALVDGLTLELKEQVARKAVNNQVTALAQKIEEAQKAVAKAEKKMANVTEERTDYEDDLGWQAQELAEARTNFLFNPLNKELSLAYTQASKNYEDFLKETDGVVMKSGEVFMEGLCAKSDLRVYLGKMNEVIGETAKKLSKVINQEKPIDPLVFAKEQYDNTKEMHALAKELKKEAYKFSEKETRVAMLQEATKRMEEAKVLLQKKAAEIQNLENSIN